MKAHTLLLAALLGGTVAAEGLPQIDDAFLQEVHRIAATLKLAEYPIPLARVEEVLALPVSEQVYGLSGKDIAPRLIWRLSRKDDRLGYYGLRLFHRPSAEGPPEVTKVELLYLPASHGRFPEIGYFILDSGDTDQEVIAELRRKMHALGLSPGEFVKLHCGEKGPKQPSHTATGRSSSDSTTSETPSSLVPRG